MNYPIWEVSEIGGGSLIALISVLHAYIAHLAVGGGLFLWLTDLWAVKTNNKEILLYVKKHVWTFLLITMVFGGISGVGIWFIIALVSPAGTSTLIHNFVFGWAIEWVFFFGEITALLIYHYRFDQLKTKDRLNISFLYALFAWLSLFIINGILTFMLSPGSWLETRGFWDGFLNPTYFPALFFRTAAGAMIAGIFGYLSIVFREHSEFRTKMMRYCSKWMLYSFPALILFGYWYYAAVPETAAVSNFQLNPQTTPFVITLLVTAGLLFLGSIYLTVKSSKPVQIIAVFVIIVLGLGWYGGFEYVREIMRKPYVIHGYMYSNSIKAEDAEIINKDGILAHAKWSGIKEISSVNQLEAGKEIFNLECLACHTVNGIRNDIVVKTKELTYMGMLASLRGQGMVRTFMPPFLGTDEEMKALAAYIIKDLHGKEIEEEPEPGKIEKHDLDVPEFDKRNDDFVLLAWNDLGMHCISDCDPWFVILPPANTLEAILIERGETPVLIDEGYEISYAVDKGFENPSKHVEFWKYEDKNFGKELEENIGVTGKALTGTFEYKDDLSGYIADHIPVAPYPDEGGFNPYPTFTVQAKDKATGKVVAKTKVVAPTSTEMGCKNCHGGEWRMGNSGVGDETAQNILKAHDRLNGTTLYEDALNGNPKNCKSCHQEVGSEGKIKDIMSLSASLHGWHANYMHEQGAKACVMCHPANPTGSTKCSRGVHDQLGLNCTDCHGTLTDHAASVLKSEPEAPSSERLLKNLKTVKVSDISEVNARKPWINQPDCLTCHEDFAKPEEGYTSYNVWNESASELFRIRTDDASVRCEACHGSPHALYPANNPYVANKDNMQPLQYMGKAMPIGSEGDCEVCHTIKMEDPVHHDNMLRAFRNKQLLK